MKEFIRRLLIVLWLIAIATASYNAITRGLLNIDTWQISAIFVLPIWALQFILTGIVNPFTLFNVKDK